MIIEIETLKDILNNIVVPNSSIGLHGVSGNKNNEKIKPIFDNGLQNSGWGGVLSNFTMYGNVSELDELDLEQIWNYTYQVDDNGNCTNIIAAIPNTIIDNNDEEYYVGTFPKDKANGYVKGISEYGADLPINQYVRDIGKMPTEFILGAIFYNAIDKKVYFYLNENYIGLKKEIELKKVGQQIKDKILVCVNKKNINNYLQLYYRLNPNQKDSLYVTQLKEYEKEYSSTKH